MTYVYSTDIDQFLAFINFLFLIYQRIVFETLFQANFEICSIGGDRSSFVAKRRSREATSELFTIKRAGYRRQERKGKRERRIGAEWLMRATAISIPAQLRCG